MRERPDERDRRFDALFASYGTDMVAYCSWRADGATDAQDAVAEVFLTAWRRLDQVPEGEAARVWLYATARKVLANQRRSNRRRVALQERLTVQAAPVSTEPTEEEALVREALRRLGPQDREVLLLAEWEGLSPAQIAVVLDCLTVTARGACIAPAGGFRRGLRAGDAGVRRTEEAPATSTYRPATAMRHRDVQEVIHA